MLFRKSLIQNFNFFTKAIHKMWIPAVLFINIAVPFVVYFFYKTGRNSQVSEIENTMFFILPAFSVWTTVFVSELFFAEKTKDVFFFLSTKEKFKISFAFYLLFLANALLIACLQFYALENPVHFVIKLLCACIFYYGLAMMMLRLSKSANTAISILLLYDVLNALFDVEQDVFLFYASQKALTLSVFMIRYLPLAVIGTILVFLAFRDKKRANS